MKNRSVRPVVGFLILACFGILFAGCGQPEPDEFVISDTDMERFRELADQADSQFLAAKNSASGSVSSSSLTADASAPRSGTGGRAQVQIPTLDLSKVELYDSIRAVASLSGDAYIVNVEGLPLRSEPAANSAQLVRLPRAAALQVIEFIDASWARVKAVSDGKEGYVAARSIAKPVTDDRLAAEKLRFENTYYVNYGFVNVRAQADTNSEKVGEIPGQSLVRPLSHDAKWSKVSYQGKEGYVSSAYLSPFSPVYLVRQEKFTLPILVYDMSQQGMMTALPTHIEALKKQGFSFTTLRALHDLLVEQGSSARLEGKNIVIGVKGVTAANAKAVSDALLAAGIRGTFFLRSDQVGMRGITEKTLLTIAANGHDIESATHSGDDLRTLTSAQVELELKQSRKLLEDMAKRSIVAVAYPEGGVNDRVTDLAAGAGYLFGVGSSPERSFTREQLLRLPSFPVFPTMTVDEVVRMATGS